MDKKRIDPRSPDYCPSCDYDRHRCPACGDGTSHDGPTEEHKRLCWDV